VDTLTGILEQVIQRGTGTRAKLDRPAAGKTGTTDNNSDAWFVGYTPQYTAAVWMGDWERSDVYMNNVGGVRVTGGSYPAEIWAAFMKPAHANLPVEQFTEPDKSQWPGAQKIDEFGRSYSREFAEPAQPRSTTPKTTAAPDATSPAADPPVAPVAPQADPNAPTAAVPANPPPAGG